MHLILFYKVVEVVSFILSQSVSVGGILPSTLKSKEVKQQLENSRLDFWSVFNSSIFTISTYMSLLAHRLVIIDEKSCLINTQSACSFTPKLFPNCSGFAAFWQVGGEKKSALLLEVMNQKKRYIYCPLTSGNITSTKSNSACT